MEDEQKGEEKGGVFNDCFFLNTNRVFNRKKQKNSLLSLLDLNLHFEDVNLLTPFAQVC